MSIASDLLKILETHGEDVFSKNISKHFVDQRFFALEESDVSSRYLYTDRIHSEVSFKNGSKIRVISSITSKKIHYRYEEC